MFFSYTAIDKQNNEIKGRVEAFNRTAAITALINKGYTISSLVEYEERSSVFDVFLRVRVKDLVIFSRQIATLFEANVAALAAFNLVSESSQNRYFQSILRDIAKSVESGFSIEKSFRQHQEVFGEFFISVIAVGEQSGTLPKSFSYLADYVERNNDITQRIRKALTYPIFVIVTFLGVMILMLVTVIPQISTVLLQTGAELPTITKVVIGLSDFFRENFTFIILAFFLSIITLIFWARTPSGRRSVDEMLVTMPLLGNMFRTFYLVRLSRNLGVMLASGVAIVSSLRTLQGIMVNRLYVDMIDTITKRVEGGTKLSVALDNQPLINKNVVQVIKVGEETGKLAHMFDVITNFYEKQLYNTIDTLLDLVQPIVIVALGAAVGLLIGSVIIPIYSISGTI